MAVSSLQQALNRNFRAYIISFLKKEETSISNNQSFSLNDKVASKNNASNLKSIMPVVTCTCGAKILVVPDLTAMKKAILNHLAVDKNATEDYLTKKILEVASQQLLH